MQYNGIERRKQGKIRIRNLLSLRKKVKANIVRQFLLSEMPGMNVRPLPFCAVRCFNVGVVLGYVWLVNDSHIDQVVFVYITPIFG